MRTPVMVNLVLFLKHFFSFFFQKLNITILKISNHICNSIDFFQKFLHFLKRGPLLYALKQTQVTKFTVGPQQTMSNAQQLCFDSYLLWYDRSKRSLCLRTPYSLRALSSLTFRPALWSALGLALYLYVWRALTNVARYGKMPKHDRDRFAEKKIRAFDNRTKQLKMREVNGPLSWTREVRSDFMEIWGWGFYCKTERVCCLSG